MGTLIFIHFLRDRNALKCTKGCNTQYTHNCTQKVSYIQSITTTCIQRHHWLNGHEFEQAQGVGDEPGNLGCFSPWMGWQRVRHNWASELNWSNCKIKHGIGDCYGHLILDNLNLEIQENCVLVFKCMPCKEKT